ncbi:MAG: hypothetical protein IKE55_11855 [Kiritimatiellae bacterium]|nr:hypothetical protein [Kiritimatiellia bacterium]
MTASELILQKALVGSDLDSSQWNRIQAGLKNRAFFSSQVAEANILAALRENAAEFAERGVDASEFRKQIRKALEELKYEPKPSEENTLKDLFSKARLDTILQTNEAQARGWIEHAQGMSAGAFAAFPAQEFLRVENREKPRQDWPLRWARAGGRIFGGRMVALKDDPVWQNLGDAGPFGNPYPPFDWGSGMGVLDVDRSEAEQLGLIDDATLRGKVDELRDAPIPDFNEHMQATIPNLRSDSLCGQILKRRFEDQVVIENSVVKWQGNLIQDVLAGKRKRVRLGGGYNGESLSLSHQFFVEHGGKHLDPNVPYEHLTMQDFELLPCLWRKPDRTLPTRDPNRTQLELDTFDNWVIVMIVDARNGIKSIQKRRKENPKGSTA